MSRRRFWVGMLAALAFAPQSVSAQQMPDLRGMSGLPLPASDVPIGSVSVRVVRGGFDRNLADQPVEFIFDGRKEVRRTDQSGRALIDGLKPGTRVRAVAVVDGEQLQSQEFTIAGTGIRVLLVASDPEAERLAKSPPVKGQVVFGPQSRIIAEFNEDRLNIYYVLQIVNSARTPVDPGGPLVVELPREARSTTLLEGSSKQATANGPRVVVATPFAPGVTPVQIAFTLPYSGPVAHLQQRWPANLQELNLLVTQVGGLDIQSPQIKDKREISDNGQRLIIANGSTIPAGQSLSLDITGLPHHPRWPRYIALSLAGVISFLGIWAAAVARPRRHAA